VIAFLLTLLMTQGIPALLGQTGTVSGVVRTSAGTPAAGVRVSAMVPPEAGTEAALAGSFAALAETDEQGRYRLVGIPQGRYYIAAGRVDLPTFYPGTADVSSARIFAITPGGAVSGIDFVMMDNSIRSASSSNVFGITNVTLAQAQIAMPIRILMEPGVKLPVFADGSLTTVRFTDTSTGVQRSQTIKDSFSFNLPVSGGTPEFRIDVVNLPVGYAVKSIMYGTTDVMTNPLKIPAALLLRQVMVMANGIIQVSTSGIRGGQTSPELTISLATVPLPAVPGVRVAGRIKDTDPRGIYLSGTSGTIYSDGTYEFRGVPPGRHSIAAYGAAGILSMGASIVVGDQDLDGILLDASPVLPGDVNIPKPPGPAGIHSPGSVLPLVSIRGRIIEEASGTPIEEGTVRLIGRDSVMASVGTGGEFEFSRLLPGTYELEVRIFGHSNVLQSIVIADEDVRVDVKTLRLY
jgi:hypothetical protein